MTASITAPWITSLVGATGLLLIYLALTSRPASDDSVPAAVPERAGRLAWLVELLHDAGVEGVRPGHILLASLAAGALTGAAAWLLLGWPLVALVAGLVGTALPVWYLRRRRETRRLAMQAALADAVAALRASVRVGMSFDEALIGLAHHGPAPLRPVLRGLARDLRLVGFDAALARARERLADPVFDTIAASLLLAHRVGGRNLGAVLDSLERAVRGAARVEHEVRAQQAKTVLSARVIAALPLGLAVVIRGMNPDYLDPFSDPLGQLLLAGGVLSVATGYALMLRAARLPAHRRSRR